MEITGIQVEISDVATDLEHRSYGEELALCQRYFHQQGRQGSNGYENFGVMAAHSTTDGRLIYSLPTTMRENPTLASNGSFQTIAGQDITGVTLPDGGGNTAVSINFEVASGLTALYAYMIRSKNDADAYIQFDSEL
tara:strand:- start:153 stop:563 length:411 start_codon:yes stop_codon:yes gene_type:complete